jgi:hypothetical protein
VIFGARADDLMARTRTWITTNEELLTFASALALGVLIALDGVVRLLTRPRLPDDVVGREASRNLARS